MTTEEMNFYQAAASLGLIPDEENVIFLFNGTHSELDSFVRRRVDGCYLVGSIAGIHYDRVLRSGVAAIVVEGALYSVRTGGDAGETLSLL